MKNSSDPALEIRCYFVRGRNFLLTRGDFCNLFVEYYLSLADSSQQLSPDLDSLLKESAVAICLHAAARPRAEVSAWTLHFEDPFCNVFVSANNPLGTVVGTGFTEQVRKEGKNLLLGEILSGNNPHGRSIVEFQGTSPFDAAAALYESSEQRPARFFCHHDEDFVLLAGQPDCDEEWLRSLREEEIAELDQTEQLSLLETRVFRWECGCNLERMLDVLAAPMKSDSDALFGGEDSLRMRCPRCGKPYIIQRSRMENHLAP